MRLLNRTTRSVTPTEAGEQLTERLAPALGEVAAALDAVNIFRDSPAGTLRLNVPTIVARAILPPLVARFLREHPGITHGGRRPTTASSTCSPPASTPACAMTNGWSAT